MESFTIYYLLLLSIQCQSKEGRITALTFQVAEAENKLKEAFQSFVAEKDLYYREKKMLESTVLELEEKEAHYQSELERERRHHSRDTTTNSSSIAIGSSTPSSLSSSLPFSPTAHHSGMMNNSTPRGGLEQVCFCLDYLFLSFIAFQ